MPILQGSMSPNEQAMTLLAGFASGSVTMEGDSIKHLPTIPDKSIVQTLNEVWGILTQKNNNDGNIIYTKKAKITQKEPKNTIARTKIPDSEIKLENIIPGSPLFVPYKQGKTKGKRKHVKNIKINIDSADISKTKMHQDQGRVGRRGQG